MSHEIVVMPTLIRGSFWCRRYGLIGANGCGKSTLLKSLAAREVPIPAHIDIYFLDREIEASDITALDCVKSVDEAKIRLEHEADALMEKELTSEIEQRLSDIYEQYVPHTLSKTFTLGGLKF